MNIAIEENDIVVTDDRDGGVIGRKGLFALCYTLQTDDVTTGEKPPCTPFSDRTSAVSSVECTADGFIVHYDIAASLTLRRENGAVRGELDSDDQTLSELGVRLPLQFLGQPGRDSDEQYVCNAPFHGAFDGMLFARRDAKNLGLLILTGDGYQIDYSPFSCGHFVLNFKCFARLDRAYRREKRDGRLVFYLFECADCADYLRRVNEITGLPCLYFTDCASVRSGASLRLQVIGQADGVEINGAYRPIDAPDGYFAVMLSGYGLKTVTPVLNGRRGGAVTVFVYDEPKDMYKRAMDSVSADDLRRTDGNLCEHQNWCTAMLRYDTLFGAPDYRDRARRLLDIVMTDDVQKAVPRLSIPSVADGDMPPYHIFRSKRLQEPFFGVSMLLAAADSFGDDGYLEYAVKVLDTLLDNYQTADGMIEKREWGIAEDYSTVTAPMIPVVDAARTLEKRRDGRAEKYFAAAEKLAAFIYRRGFDFPTETSPGQGVQPEVEEGSVACAALSLLYYCRHVRRSATYLKRAKEWLDFHDVFSMRSPHACLFHSTLRWWETCWEGDGNGPAICGGHGWTIWRAEADYLYYLLTDDAAYRTKAINGFMTNFAKFDEQGRGKAIFQPDLIAGGGLSRNAADVRFAVTYGFPQSYDSGMSRYAFVRASEYFFGK